MWCCLCLVVLFGLLNLLYCFVNCFVRCVSYLICWCHGRVCVCLFFCVCSCYCVRYSLLLLSCCCCLFVFVCVVLFDCFLFVNWFVLFGC